MDVADAACFVLLVVSRAETRETSRGERTTPMLFEPI